MSTQALFVQVWFVPQQAVPHAVGRAARAARAARGAVADLASRAGVRAAAAVGRVGRDAGAVALEQPGRALALAGLAGVPAQTGDAAAAAVVRVGDVFTHCEPQAVWPEGQLTVPPVPVAPLPAVPGVPVVEGLEQAVAKMAKETKQRPKNETRPVFIVIRIPGETRPDLPRREFNAIAPAANSTKLVHENRRGSH